MAVSFIQEVEGYKIQSHIGDQWVWAADPSGQYSIRSAYSVLREDISEEAQDGEFKELWKLKVPPKVAVFAWRLLKDRLPTRDNLRRKQVELHEYLCPFCRTMEESACHLFFHCRKVLPVWWESLSWVNLYFVHITTSIIQSFEYQWKWILKEAWLFLTKLTIWRTLLGMLAVWISKMFCISYL
ncbi:uncharacterized protein [Glycine max]|uniref:uncharacterized protein isoform X2 n=1 Tax=Glycine max TaxID=3847 RepID=UPI001B35473E|nr:uncharacterized protein LOC100799982 isoform X2 [Glycine max]XP_040866061.1 uncharacterized protein LOC100799982 isoform X2 [Glycine max]